MRRRHHPRSRARRRRAIPRGMNNDVRHSLERLGQSARHDVRGSFKNRIVLADEDQRINLLTRRRFGQVGQRAHRSSARVFHFDHLAKRTQRLIDGDGQQMQRRAVRRAGHDNCRTLLRYEVLRRRREPGFIVFARLVSSVQHHRARRRFQRRVARLLCNDLCQFHRHFQRLTGVNAQPVIRHAARERVAAFDGIQPAHFRAIVRRLRLPFRHELPH